MADNVQITAGTGTTIAADDIGAGVLVQRVKAVLGADGTGVDPSAGAGNSGTGVQRVTLATDDVNAAVINTKTTAIAASLAAGATAIAKAEDTASADADVGVPALAVRKATPANTSGTDGDYEFLQMFAGRLWASATIDAALPAGEAFVGKTGGIIVTPTANFTRPADTTAYAVGDAVSNNVTAGSVVALSWTAARVATGNFYVRRARVKKSTTSVTNAAFRLHIYAADPTASTGIVGGDNAAFSTKVGTWIGAIDITVSQAFSDASMGIGAPNVGTEINAVLVSGQTLYGLLEARGAYTPGSAEVFTVDLEIWQN